MVRSGSLMGTARSPTQCFVIPQVKRLGAISTNVIRSRAVVGVQRVGPRDSNPQPVSDGMLSPVPDLTGGLEGNVIRLTNPLGKGSEAIGLVGASGVAHRGAISKTPLRCRTIQPRETRSPSMLVAAGDVRPRYAGRLRDGEYRRSQSGKVGDKLGRSAL